MQNRIINQFGVRFATVALAFLMLLMIPSTLSACPTCKNALHNGAATGYAISILFMMLMPFGIFAFWAVLIIRLRRQMAASNPSHPDSEAALSTCD